MKTKLKHWFQNGIFCMVAATLFFALMGLFVKIALQAHVPVAEAVFFRSVVSAAILGGMIFYRRDSFIGRRPGLLLGRAFAGFVAINLNFYAIAHIPLADASMLNQSSPLFVVLFSYLLLGERFPAKLLYLTLFSLVGIALILKPSLHLELPALAGVGSGMAAAFAFIAIRQLHHTDSAFTMAFYFTAFSGLGSIPFMIHNFSVPPLPILLCLLGAGLAGTLGQLLMTYSYKHEAPSVVASFSYLNVLFSFLFGILFFQESPDLWSILGSAIVITCCIVLSSVKSK